MLLAGFKSICFEYVTLNKGCFILPASVLYMCDVYFSLEYAYTDEHECWRDWGVALVFKNNTPLRYAV